MYKNNIKMYLKNVMIQTVLGTAQLLFLVNTLIQILFTRKGGIS
jgi:hypothetical protein